MTLTIDDYILGVFDMVGELMKFSITAIATSGQIPSSEPKQDPDPRETDMDYESDLKGSQKRDVLSDLRELRIHLEKMDASTEGLLGRDVGKKMGVMQTCVQKVENALYGLIVRGSERPKGWVPGTEAVREEIEGY